MEKIQPTILKLRQKPESMFSLLEDIICCSVVVKLFEVFQLSFNESIGNIITFYDTNYGQNSPSR